MNDVSGGTVIVIGIVALVVGFLICLVIVPTQVDGDKMFSQADIDQAVSGKDNEIDSLNNLLEKCGKDTEQETENETTEDTKISGYVIDKLFLESPFIEDIFSDREIDLFDGEVEFDGEDYDAEETLILKDFVLKANDNDFEGIPYLIVPDGALEFKFVFEDDLNTSLINDEETLIFSLFGEEVEISEWDVDEITFTKGNYVRLEEGETTKFENKTILVAYVSENSIWVEVDGEEEKINEGSVEKVNGVDIKVLEVFEGSSSRLGFSELVIGEDVEVTISDGDEYEEDSIWEWAIDSYSIGLVLVEEFTELDEEFNALDVGKKVCLPNDYVCILFNGMIEEDSEEYTFKLDDEFVKVKGSFEFGIEDYEEIYIYNNGSIYEDDDTKDYIGEVVKLSNSDLTIFLDSENKIVIGDFEVNLDLNVTNVGSHDYNWLTKYGILVENTEDAIEDQEFKITVPEEKLEGSISLI